MPGQLREQESMAQERLWREGLRLASVLEAAGHAAYLVGGCVRDRLLGRAISDIDIATSALPEQVQALFPKVIPTGLQHGTVTVMVAGEGFEVTTFRREAQYSDGRHPDEVAFVRDVEEDLARRDFTINAIAWGTDDRRIDPFGGEEDLARRVVRCVGKADERFGEDALRMLRGIRFAAEFGFELEDDTWKAIGASREKLARIAMERVGVELEKMIAGRHPTRAIGLLHGSGLLACAKAKLEPPLPQLGAETEARWPRLASAEHRWAALLLLAGADERRAAAWMRALKYSAKRTAAVSSIVALSAELARLAAGEAAVAGAGAGEATGASVEAGGAADTGADVGEATGARLAAVGEASAGAGAVEAVGARLDAVGEVGAGAAAGASTGEANGGVSRESWTEAALRFGDETASGYLAAAGAFPEIDAPLWQRHGIEAARRWTDEMPATTVKELALRGDELCLLLGREAGPWVAAELQRLLLLVALRRLANEPEALRSEALRARATDGDET
ncbi:CCA tRNA nucleotidyltransferase [Cohnella fermenti]|uniref:CCA tRNA nucleotidyltransferase n=1 Tax=Cohnella fermenti TaxID=2565925 RepID=A0A4S4BTK5_9BACL|nr:CCA tRNA nucleotidyltransferase [Cohnella fermenti]THF78403.1 CCA tRNA nucleotidyltransferase [Cohnella fermenti]